MSTPLPPIYCDCRRLLVLTEEMVRRFSCHHKYARHYVRYVDDFVLLAEDAYTLRQRQSQIVQFLQGRLLLRLKDEHHLAPTAQGIDLLGYLLDPSHRLARRHAVCGVQKGCKTLRFGPVQHPVGSSLHARPTGLLRHGTRRRGITGFLVPSEISP